MAADARTILVLAFRHLVVRRGRALVLLIGYALGAAVMMVLLAVGEAMLIQSRDVSLVGGGEVTILPEGIDLEGLRTGSIAGMFFGIDRARFLERQLVGGPRQRDVIAATSPLIERKLLYLVRGDRRIPIRAGAEIPSRARAVGSALAVRSGAWNDSPADRRFVAPTSQELYDEIDRFHPPGEDSTWGEWHYFNLAPAVNEWWYLTYLLGGRWSRGAGGGQLLVTRHRAGRPPARFIASVAQADVHYDTTRADLSIGAETVTQRNGQYRIVGQAPGEGGGSVRFDLTVTPEPNAYFPPVELSSGRFVSGYVVPGVRAVASGTLCENGECRAVSEVPSYHDHNWGIWRETTWEWGQARGSRTSVVYGGVRNPAAGSSPTGSPYFLAAVDGQGVRQVLRFGAIEYRGMRAIPGAPGLSAPETFTLRAARDRDTLTLSVRVLLAQATPAGVAGTGRMFLQLRGQFHLDGQLAGAAVADSGLGFFETFLAAPATRPGSRPNASSPRSARRAESRGAP